MSYYVFVCEFIISDSMTIKGLGVIIQIWFDLIFRRAAFSFEYNAAMRNLITQYL